MKKAIQINRTELRIPAAGRQARWLFTSTAEKLRQGALFKQLQLVFRVAHYNNLGEVQTNHDGFTRPYGMDTCLKNNRSSLAINYGQDNSLTDELLQQELDR